MNTQPNALRLAEHLEWADTRDLSSLALRIKSANELRRLHALNQELLEALKKISRTEYHIEMPPIESLEEKMRRIARAAIAKAGENK